MVKAGGQAGDWLTPFRGHGIRRKLGLYRDPSSTPALLVAEEPPPRVFDQVAPALVAAARAGDDQSLAEHIGRLAPANHTPLDIVIASIEVKITGKWDPALQLLDKLLETAPEYLPAHYERAVILRHFGRLNDAVLALRQAHRCDPDDFRSSLLLVQLLYGVDAEATPAVAIRPRSEEESRQLARARLEGAYLVQFPRAQARAIVADVRDHYGWLGTAQVAQAIRQALKDKRGFALIRLGDGEGAFARVDEDDEARHAELYALYRREWTSFLLGDGFDPVATGYEALTETLMAVSAEADVLGLPYMSWIEHEYDILSPRTIAGLLNIHRNLLARPPLQRPQVCDQLMHLHLFTSGEIEPIIRAAGRVSVISCLPQLTALLMRRFELEEVVFEEVPSEADAPHLHREIAGGRPHFPAVFDELNAKLARPHHGRLWLIAAGTLGKFYAATIKRHGGVALDVGSLVDAWMRLPSRIMYDDSLALEPGDVGP